MAEYITVLGMVVSAMSVGDYDKRLVIITGKYGKLTVFARGARRQNSRFTAVSMPFTFGEFTLYPGKDAYSLTDAQVKEYFDGISANMSSMYHGFYFLELAGVYTMENMPAEDILKLLYYSLKALLNKNIPDALVRRIFELRILVQNGEYPGVFECGCCKKPLSDSVCYDGVRKIFLCEKCSEGRKRLNVSTIYSLQYIITSPLKKLFSFNVSDAVFSELNGIVEDLMRVSVDRPLKSAGMLEIVLE